MTISCLKDQPRTEQLLKRFFLVLRCPQKRFLKYTKQWKWTRLGSLMTFLVPQFWWILHVLSYCMSRILLTDTFIRFNQFISSLFCSCTYLLILYIMHTMKKELYIYVFDFVIHVGHSLLSSLFPILNPSTSKIYNYLIYRTSTPS